MTQVAVFTNNSTSGNHFVIQNAINSFLQSYPQASNVKVEFCPGNTLFTVMVTIETETPVAGI